MPTSHQTVRIARGRHRSPREGACVLEMASMLAGERFSDRPRCVDPVLAAFLRAFNDRLSHRDRQRLVPYASRVVGTRRGGRRRCRERLRQCLAFAGMRSHAVARLRFGLMLGLRWTLRLKAGAGEFAARVAIADDRVEDGFELLDRLVGTDGGALTSPPRTVPCGETPQLVPA